MPTVTELKTQAKSLGVKGYSKMNKKELNKSISNSILRKIPPVSKIRAHAKSVGVKDHSKITKNKVMDVISQSSKRSNSQRKKPPHERYLIDLAKEQGIINLEDNTFGETTKVKLSGNKIIVRYNITKKPARNSCYGKLVKVADPNDINYLDNVLFIKWKKSVERLDEVFKYVKQFACWNSDEYKKELMDTFNLTESQSNKNYGKNLKKLMIHKAERMNIPKYYREVKSVSVSIIKETPDTLYVKEELMLQSKKNVINWIEQKTNPSSKYGTPFNHVGIYNNEIIILESDTSDVYEFVEKKMKKDKKKYLSDKRKERNKIYKKNDMFFKNKKDRLSKNPLLQEMKKIQQHRRRGYPNLPSMKYTTVHTPIEGFEDCVKNNDPLRIDLFYYALKRNVDPVEAFRSFKRDTPELKYFNLVLRKSQGRDMIGNKVIISKIGIVLKESLKKKYSFMIR